MRMTGSTMISRDSIVDSRMEGGSKGKIKEGPCPAAFHAKAPLLVQSSYSDVPAAARASALSANPWPCTTLPFANLHTCQKVKVAGIPLWRPLPAERRARHDAIACVDQGVDLGVRAAELVV